MFVTKPRKANSTWVLLHVLLLAQAPELLGTSPRLTAFRAVVMYWKTLDQRCEACVRPAPARYTTKNQLIEQLQRKRNDTGNRSAVKFCNGIEGVRHAKFCRLNKILVHTCSQSIPVVISRVTGPWSKVSATDLTQALFWTLHSCLSLGKGRQG